MTLGVLRDRPGLLFADRRVRLVTSLLTAAVLLAAAYRIALTGVAENFSRTDPERAVRISPRLPVALRARVEQLRVESPPDSARIERLLRESLSADPVEGRSFGLLGLEAANQGRSSVADRLLDAGIRRAPRDTDLRFAAISRSLLGNHLDEAVRHIMAVLRVRPDRAGETGRAHEYIGWLWNVYGGSPEGREAVMRLALTPSPWRAAFLTHVASHAAPAEALHLMGELKRRTLAPSPTEYDAVVRTLLSRREWHAAFALWMQDPARSEVGTVANLYNGDFSQNPDGRPGFDWELIQPTGARIALEEASAKERHLRVDLLRGQPVSGVLARHLLVLGPGNHELRARSRSERLGSDRVPILSMSCLHLAGSTPIAMLKLGDGGSAWRSFSTSVQIPKEQCAAQELELRLDLPRRATDPGAGALWMDDVFVVRSRGHRVSTARVGLEGGPTGDQK